MGWDIHGGGTGGHFGCDKTIASVEERFFRPSLKKDLWNIIKQCQASHVGKGSKIQGYIGHCQCCIRRNDVSFNEGLLSNCCEVSIYLLNMFLLLSILNLREIFNLAFTFASVYCFFKQELLLLSLFLIITTEVVLYPQLLS